MALETMEPAIRELETNVGTVCPWLANPYALVNWWNMEKFAADKFCKIASNIASLTYYFGGDGRSMRQMPAGELIGLAEQLEGILPDVEGIGLKTSGLLVRDSVKRLREISGWVSPQIVQLLTCINVTINSEMSTQLFVRIFPERSDFFENPNLFGNQVEASFPSASRDIMAAGTCYALDRNTASVMHSMRCLETPLVALADRLNVTIKKPDWENVINDVESAIGKVNGPHAGLTWKEERDFLAGAAMEFRYIKNAWRNHAMHAREHYDANEARSVLDHIKALMVHLADNGMKEKP
jgi:hypothetical protein